MATKHDPTDITTVKRAIDLHLEHRGHNDKWLYDRIGLKKGSYYDMWRRGSLRVDILLLMAQAFDLSPAELLTPPGAPLAMAGEDTPRYGAKRFLEERVDELERVVAQLARKPLRT